MRSNRLNAGGVFLAILIFFGVERAAAAPGAVRGRGGVAVVERGPLLDGTLSDPVWERAEPMVLGDVTGDKASPQRTVGRVVMDQERLYVGIECGETDLAALDDPKGKDRVEFWVWADPDRPIRHVSVNGAGVVTTDAFYGDIGSSTPWNAHADVKRTIVDGKGWTITVAIPLRELDAYVGKGLTWRFNMTRVRPERGGVKGFESSWAILPTDEFYQPEQFGWLSGVTIGSRPDGVRRERAPAAWSAGPQFPREEMHLGFAGQDEAVSDLRIANNRWPDCYDDATAMHDILRLEGVGDKNGQAKALALWKWCRILVSASCGGYCYEADNSGGETFVHDPNKILTVYGHHQCDGLSWSMAGMWRSVGYMGFDECHLGHTIVSLRYEDDDGKWRFHDLDPQSRYYYWNGDKKIIGTWTIPITRNRVHRHMTCSEYIHDLRRSMRIGETINWLWNNEGHVIPPNVQKKQVELTGPYKYTSGRTNGVYAAAGQETQTLVAEVSPEHFGEGLFDGSANVAASSGGEGRAALHPLKAGSPGIFVYRMQSAYPAVDGNLSATLGKGKEGDTCRLWLSTDGGFNWQLIRDKKSTGAEEVNIDLGTAARAEGQPNIYSVYDFLIKAEFASDSDAGGVGMNGLKIVADRELNKRTLANLMPGMNCFRVSFARLAAGKLLEVEVNYSVNGKAMQLVRHVSASPFYFRIDTGDVQEKWLKNYDQAFNVGALRMDSIKFRLVDEGGHADTAKADASDSTITEEDFQKAYPHPADMTDLKPVAFAEGDPMETSGFFPQEHAVKHDAAAMEALIQTMKTGGVLQQWGAAEDLGEYPDSLEVLLQAWPDANGDLKMHLCKALAEIGDKRALGPLLGSWSEAPRGGPGSRYIPDVLGAIGDRSIVPALVAPMHGLRFDYRFHIAYALGKLGGAEAEAALADLARNDPFAAVRAYAERTLAKMRSQPSSGK